MGDFFAELKRRQIYRVGAAYAVVAWVLLQLVNNVAPVFDLPAWIARAVVVVLAIGLQAGRTKGGRSNKQYQRVCHTLCTCGADIPTDWCGYLIALASL
jgi:hypothetical protein